MKYVDRVGEYVRSEGNEDIYYCNDCGSRGLHINQEKNEWYCFGCGYGGKIPYSTNEPLVHIHPVPNHKEFNFWYSEYTSYLKSCPTWGGNPQPLRYTSHDSLSVFRVLDIGGIKGYAFPVRKLSTRNMIGIHTYMPDMTPKYRTFGDKGWVGSIQKNPKRICIFEGVFDMVAYYQQQSGSVIDISYICSLGNTPSKDQLLDLLEYAKDTESIHVCYDNDKYTPVLGLVHYLRDLLSSKCIVMAHTPPSEGGVKDWYDYYYGDSSPYRNAR